MSARVECRLEAGDMASRIPALLLRGVLCAMIACAQRAPEPAKPALQSDQVQSIDNTDMRRTVTEPPPVLSDIALSPKPKAKSPPGPPADQPPAESAPMLIVPFAPAIAMDPVDGSKIAMTTATPTAELKGHIYYFSSQENKQKFLADPTPYLKGPFSHL